MISLYLVARQMERGENNGNVNRPVLRTMPAPAPTEAGAATTAATTPPRNATMPSSSTPSPLRPAVSPPSSAPPPPPSSSSSLSGRAMVPPTIRNYNDPNNSSNSNYNNYNNVIIRNLNTDPQAQILAAAMAEQQQKYQQQPQHQQPQYQHPQQYQQPQQQQYHHHQQQQQMMMAPPTSFQHHPQQYQMQQQPNQQGYGTLPDDYHYSLSWLAQSEHNDNSETQPLQSNDQQQQQQSQWSAYWKPTSATASRILGNVDFRPNIGLSNSLREHSLFGWPLHQALQRIQGSIILVTTWTIFWTCSAWFGLLFHLHSLLLSCYLLFFSTILWLAEVLSFFFPSSESIFFLQDQFGLFFHPVGKSFAMILMATMSIGVEANVFSFTSLIAGIGHAVNAIALLYVWTGDPEFRRFYQQAQQQYDRQRASRGPQQQQTSSTRRQQEQQQSSNTNTNDDIGSRTVAWSSLAAAAATAASSSRTTSEERQGLLRSWFGRK